MKSVQDELQTEREIKMASIDQNFTIVAVELSKL